jgi:hypothetical protein
MKFHGHQSRRLGAGRVPMGVLLARLRAGGAVGRAVPGAAGLVVVEVGFLAGVAGLGVGGVVFISGYYTVKDGQGTRMIGSFHIDYISL